MSLEMSFSFEKSLLRLVNFSKKKLLQFNQHSRFCRNAFNYRSAPKGLNYTPIMCPMWPMVDYRGSRARPRPPVEEVNERFREAVDALFVQRRFCRNEAGSGERDSLRFEPSRSHRNAGIRREKMIKRENTTASAEALRSRDILHRPTSPMLT